MTCATRTKTDRNGTVFTYTYDPLGRLVSEAALGEDLSTASRTFTYYDTGELKTASEGNLTRQYAYNSEGLLTQVTDSEMGTAQSCTYKKHVVVQTFPRREDTFFAARLVRRFIRRGRFDKNAVMPRDPKKIYLLSCR